MSGVSEFYFSQIFHLWHFLLLIKYKLPNTIPDTLNILIAKTRFESLFLTYICTPIVTLALNTIYKDVSKECVCQKTDHAILLGQSNKIKNFSVE